MESSTQEETEQFIFEETEYHFQLAMEAPISRTKLIDQLGYLGDSKISQQIIEGTYDVPDKIDNATALILEEINKIGTQLKNGEVVIEITKEEFKHFWHCIKEGMASYYSGIHYGHYKASAFLEKISNFL